MTEPFTTLALAGFSLAGLSIALYATLKGWQGWLELKRLELAGNRQHGPASTIERIEVADLRERIRKLESIASCIDL